MNIICLKTKLKMFLNVCILIMTYMFSKSVSQENITQTYEIQNNRCDIMVYKGLKDFKKYLNTNSLDNNTFVFGLSASYVLPYLRYAGIPVDEFYELVLMSADLVASAINLAIEDFCNKTTNMDLSFRILFLDDMCSPKIGVPNVIEMHKTGVDVVFGMPCSTVTIHAGYYLKHYNMPLISYASNEAVLSDKTTYQTLIRVAAGYKQLGSAFVEILREFNWTTVSILSRSRDFCGIGKTLVQQAIERDQLITLAEHDHVVDNPTDEELLTQLRNFRARARVLILCMTRNQLIRFMDLAYLEGMTTADYVYLTFYPSQVDLKPWSHGDGVDEITYQRRKEAFTRLKMVVPEDLSDASKVALMGKITGKMSENPWYINTTKDYGIKESPFGLYLYDGVWLYLTIIHELINEGLNPRDGKLIFERARNRIFAGVSGEVTMDDVADRIPNYWLWQLQPHDTVYTHFATLRMFSPVGKRITMISPAYWGTEDGKAPPNEPLCGYKNEKCIPQPKSKTAAIVSGICSVVSVLVIIYTGQIYYRRKKFENDIQNMQWKIKYEDIDFSFKPSGGGSVITANSIMSRSFRSALSVTKEQEQIFTRVCKYKSVLFAMKKIEKTDSKLGRQDLIDLKQARDLNHENINSFIGASIHMSDIYILTNYCAKGSLQDVLEKDEIKLDWMFKCSLIYDLVNGLSYIHSSPFSSHGHLTSSQCLIDSRWVLKIANVGLNTIKFANVKCSKRSEYESYRDELWVSPELLRLDNRPIRGYQRADIYSLSIILYEIVFRTSPYFDDNTSLSPKEIVQRVKQRLQPPFRPNISTSGYDIDMNYITLIKECWDENPESRPNVEKVKKKLSHLNSGKKVNILDSMVQKLERYANNLEEIVDKRTEELVLEKQKTDSLLYRMLPTVVAEQLKNGTTVPAEIYQSVTIYFSDVVGFTALSSESSAVQIVDLLNDLYSLFDDIIMKHDVYKVETIGDAYMCVSGCPNTNGDRHAAEIADMSLALRENVKKFKMRHKPDKCLQVRIGIHTGPCAAGVVGLTMPRYCLFGDTVNVASRMESNGQAMKIHISEETQQLLVDTKQYIISCRGQVELKGKGTVTTYWLEGYAGTKR